MIYFDNAATTLQKPPGVLRAMASALTTMASPGRGDHGPAARAAELLLSCREEAAAQFQVSQPERVILTTSATHGLNIAVKSLVKPGSTVLLSGYEHNAVLRPLAAIPGVTLRTVQAPLFQPELFLRAMKRQLTPDVDAVLCTHVSNVFGYVLPIEDIAALCRQRDVPFLVDAAQSAGVLPLRLEDWGAEFVAMPGHKGLYGPQGTGLLLCRTSGEPILFGGTGSASRLTEMPKDLPDRLEAGTHNVTGTAGLLAGLQFVRSIGEATLLRHEVALKEQAAEGLSKLPGVTVYRSKSSCQTGVLSFRIQGKDPSEIGDRLNQKGIAVRTGLHCAPAAHITGGTERTGTVRLSFSAFNTSQETERFLSVIRRLI